MEYTAYISYVRQKRDRKAKICEKHYIIKDIYTGIFICAKWLHTGIILKKKKNTIYGIKIRAVFYIIILCGVIRIYSFDKNFV